MATLSRETGKPANGRTTSGSFVVRACIWLACSVAGATFGCHGSGDVCLSQEIAGSSGCAETLGFAVSECNNCEAIVGCDCAGSDCPEIFATKKECDDFVGGAACHCK